MLYTPLIENHQFTLAENLLWDHKNQQYWFLDIDDTKLYCFTIESNNLDHWSLPELTGCMALSNDGNVLLGMTSGIFHFDLKSRQQTFICHPLETYSTDVRYNDGRVDQDGNFWFSSMDQSSDRRPIASLFCLLANGTALTIKDGVRVGNGIAFDDNGDNDRLYFSDTRAPKIYTANRQQVIQQALEGKSANFETFAIADDSIGRPDGGTVDSIGNYWSAGVSAGNLNQFSPDGKLLNSYKTPMNNPTIPCFGGNNLDQLSVASLQKDKTSDSSDGKICTSQSPTLGKKEHRFNWTNYISQQS